MVVRRLFHFVQTIARGPFTKPQALTWRVGVFLLCCALGLKSAGYLLPWDQKAFATRPAGLAKTPARSQGVPRAKNRNGEQPVATPAPASSEVRTRAAAVLYRQHCQVCHAADGRGRKMKSSMPTIPDFTNRTWHAAVSNERLVAATLQGKGDFMPGFRWELSDAQVRDLVAFIRTIRPARQVAPPAGGNDFERRFLELEEEWGDLHRRLRELSRLPRNP
jgi:mono/diheme cytochrome c family protein